MAGDSMPGTQHIAHPVQIFRWWGGSIARAYSPQTLNYGAETAPSRQQKSHALRFDGTPTPSRPALPRTKRALSVTKRRPIAQNRNPE